MMFNYNNYVYMQYNEGTDGGSGGGPVVDLEDTESSPGYSFVASDHQFTDPPRFFKANDPYYYEVDNIPLKQLHENCLWLRDQMTGIELNTTGVPLSKVIDLQPMVSNADRIVTVRPGKFTARINDAYGLTELFSEQSLNQPLVDIARDPVYLLSPIVATNSVFQTIVGSTLDNLFYGNGLYNELQHHAASINLSSDADSGAYPITITFNPSYLNDETFNLDDLPKIRHAAWKQKSAQPDAQQRAVDFTRRWQGVYRTAVVNVVEDLSVDIPPFSAADFLDIAANEYDPQVRIDLVFLYSHPIDAAVTHIAKKSGEGAPESLTSCRIGVVKGAGALLGPRNGAIDISDGQGIGDAAWIQQSESADKFYGTSGALEPGMDLAIQSPMSDQAMLGVTNPPFPGKTTGLSFPSPDDLLNLAPIVSEEAVGESLVSIGQSVLPICYVIVKKDADIIFEQDIIDIRPFLRTTELAYNERAGIGAANPPLSLANPSTGKAELYSAIQQLRAYIDDHLLGVVEDVNSIVGAVPTSSPELTAQLYRSATSFNPHANMVVMDYQTFSNPPLGDVTNEYADWLGGKVFETSVESNIIKLVPGTYRITGDIAGMFSSNDGGYGTYVVSLNSATDGTKLWPLTTIMNNRLIFRAFKHQSDDNFRESDGSVSFSTILKLYPPPPPVEGEAPQDPVTQLQIRVSRSTNGPNITARGSVTIVRVGNADGTTGGIG